MKKNIGDSFESYHGSKWTVTAVNDGGSFVAKSSDGIGYLFEKSGKFSRHDLSEKHPYDLRRPWEDREKEDKENAELERKAKTEAEIERLKVIADQEKQQKRQVTEIAYLKKKSKLTKNRR